MSKSEYFHYIGNHKKYTDFNTLGLYRSITENERLEIKEQIEVLEYANSFFEKTFNFYPLKDPRTYFNLITLGKELTIADEHQIWEDIRLAQQKILSDKRIKHRNFGDYSKHNCGYDDCPYNGLMIKQGSHFAEWTMHFNSDKSKFCPEEKSERVKKQRRSKFKIIQNELDQE